MKASGTIGRSAPHPHCGSWSPKLDWSVFQEESLLANAAGSLIPLTSCISVPSPSTTSTLPPSTAAVPSVADFVELRPPLEGRSGHPITSVEFSTTGRFLVAGESGPSACAIVYCLGCHAKVALYSMEAARGPGSTPSTQTPQSYHLPMNRQCLRITWAGLSRCDGDFHASDTLSVKSEASASILTDGSIPEWLAAVSNLGVGVWSVNETLRNHVNACPMTYCLKTSRQISGKGEVTGPAPHALEKHSLASCVYYEAHESVISDKIHAVDENESKAQIGKTDSLPTATAIRLNEKGEEDGTSELVTKPLGLVEPYSASWSYQLRKDESISMLAVCGPHYLYVLAFSPSSTIPPIRLNSRLGVHANAHLVQCAWHVLPVSVAPTIPNQGSLPMDTPDTILAPLATQSLLFLTRGGILGVLTFKLPRSLPLPEVSSTAPTSTSSSSTLPSSTADSSSSSSSSSPSSSSSSSSSSVTAHSLIEALPTVSVELKKWVDLRLPEASSFSMYSSPSHLTSPLPSASPNPTFSSVPQQYLAVCGAQGRMRFFDPVSLAHYYSLPKGPSCVPLHPLPSITTHNQTSTNTKINERTSSSTSMTLSSTAPASSTAPPADMFAIRINPLGSLMAVWLSNRSLVIYQINKSSVTSTPARPAQPSLSTTLYRLLPAPTACVWNVKTPSWPRTAPCNPHRNDLMICSNDGTVSFWTPHRVDRHSYLHHQSPLSPTVSSPADTVSHPFINAFMYRNSAHFTTSDDMFRGLLLPTSLLTLSKAANPTPSATIAPLDPFGVDTNKQSVGEKLKTDDKETQWDSTIWWRRGDPCDLYIGPITREPTFVSSPLHWLPQARSSRAVRCIEPLYAPVLQMPRGSRTDGPTSSLYYAHDMQYLGLGLADGSVSIANLHPQHKDVQSAIHCGSCEKLLSSSSTTCDLCHALREEASRLQSSLPPSITTALASLPSTSGHIDASSTAAILAEFMPPTSTTQTPSTSTTYKPHTISVVASVPAHNDEVTALSFSPPPRCPPLTRLDPSSSSLLHSCPGVLVTASRDSLIHVIDSTSLANFNAEHSSSPSPLLCTLASHQASVTGVVAVARTDPYSESSVTIISSGADSNVAVSHLENLPFPSFTSTSSSSLPLPDPLPPQSLHGCPVLSVSTHPKLSECATVGLDGHVRIWNTLSGAELRSFPIPRNVSCFFKVNSLSAANDLDEGGDVDDAGATPPPVEALHVALDPSGSILSLCLADMRLRLVDWFTGSALAEYSTLSALPTSSTFTQDCKHVAVSLADGTTIILDLPDLLSTDLFSRYTEALRSPTMITHYQAKAQRQAIKSCSKARKVAQRILCASSTTLAPSPSNRGHETINPSDRLAILRAAASSLVTTHGLLFDRFETPDASIYVKGACDAHGPSELETKYLKLLGLDALTTTIMTSAGYSKDGSSSLAPLDFDDDSEDDDDDNISGNSLAKVHPDQPQTVTSTGQTDVSLSPNEPVSLLQQLLSTVNLTAALKQADLADSLVDHTDVSHVVDAKRSDRDIPSTCPTTSTTPSLSDSTNQTMSPEAPPPKCSQRLDGPAYSHVPLIAQGLPSARRRRAWTRPSHSLSNVGGVDGEDIGSPTPLAKSLLDRISALAHSVDGSLQTHSVTTLQAACSTSSSQSLSSPDPSIHFDRPLSSPTTGHPLADSSNPNVTKSPSTSLSSTQGDMLGESPVIPGQGRRLSRNRVDGSADHLRQLLDSFGVPETVTGNTPQLAARALSLYATSDSHSTKGSTDATRNGCDTLRGHQSERTPGGQNKLETDGTVHLTFTVDASDDVEQGTIGGANKCSAIQTAADALSQTDSRFFDTSSIGIRSTNAVNVESNTLLVRQGSRRGRVMLHLDEGGDEGENEDVSTSRQPIGTYSTGGVLETVNSFKSSTNQDDMVNGDSDAVAKESVKHVGDEEYAGEMDAFENDTSSQGNLGEVSDADQDNEDGDADFDLFMAVKAAADAHNTAQTSSLSTSSALPSSRCPNDEEHEFARCQSAQQISSSNTKPTETMEASLDPHELALPLSPSPVDMPSPTNVNDRRECIEPTTTLKDKRQGNKATSTGGKTAVPGYARGTASTHAKKQSAGKMSMKKLTATKAEESTPRKLRSSFSAQFLRIEQKEIMGSSTPSVHPPTPSHALSPIAITSFPPSQPEPSISSMLQSSTADRNGGPDTADSLSTVSATTLTTNASDHSMVPTAHQEKLLVIRGQNPETEGHPNQRVQSTQPEQRQHQLEDAERMIPTDPLSLTASLVAATARVDHLHRSNAERMEALEALLDTEEQDRGQRGMRNASSNQVTTNMSTNEYTHYALEQPPSLQDHLIAISSLKSSLSRALKLYAAAVSQSRSPLSVSIRGQASTTSNASGLAASKPGARGICPSNTSVDAGDEATSSRAVVTLYQEAFAGLHSLLTASLPSAALEESTELSQSARLLLSAQAEDVSAPSVSAMSPSRVMSQSSTALLGHSGVETLSASVIPSTMYHSDKPTSHMPSLPLHRLGAQRATRTPPSTTSALSSTSLDHEGESILLGHPHRVPLSGGQADRPQSKWLRDGIIDPASLRLAQSIESTSSSLTSTLTNSLVKGVPSIPKPMNPPIPLTGDHHDYNTAADGFDNPINSQQSTELSLSLTSNTSTTSSSLSISRPNRTHSDASLSGQASTHIQATSTSIPTPNIAQVKPEGGNHDDRSHDNGHWTLGNTKRNRRRQKKARARWDQQMKGQDPTAHVTSNMTTSSSSSTATLRPSDPAPALPTMTSPRSTSIVPTASTKSTSNLISSPPFPLPSHPPLFSSSTTTPSTNRMTSHPQLEEKQTEKRNPPPLSSSLIRPNNNATASNAANSERSLSAKRSPSGSVPTVNSNPPKNSNPGLGRPTVVNLSLPSDLHSQSTGDSGKEAIGSATSSRPSHGSNRNGETVTSSPDAGRGGKRRKAGKGKGRR